MVQKRRLDRARKPDHKKIDATMEGFRLANERASKKIENALKASVSRSAKEMRLRLGMTQVSFSDLLGIHVQTLSKIERGITVANMNLVDLIYSGSRFIEMEEKVAIKVGKDLVFLMRLYGRMKALAFYLFAFDSEYRIGEFPFNNNEWGDSCERYPSHYLMYTHSMICFDDAMKLKQKHPHHVDEKDESAYWTGNRISIPAYHEPLPSGDFRDFQNTMPPWLDCDESES